MRYRPIATALARVGFVAVYVVVIALGTIHTRASSVTSRLVAGNPTCSDIGYASGFKPEPQSAPAGTYAVPDYGDITVDSNASGLDSWSTTFGIDAVIVKAGNAANVYTYDPEATGDTNLVTPANASGNPAGLSHVVFCFDKEYNLAVTKSATTAFTRTYGWDIDKTAAPASWNLFMGDSGMSEYAVDVTKTVTDSGWVVGGTITVTNPHPSLSAANVAVTDTLAGYGSPTVNCPKTTLAALESMTCSYGPVAVADGTTRLNTATATTTTEGIGSGSGTASAAFGVPTTVSGYDEITVSDSDGQSWALSDSGTRTYSREFTCDESAGTYTYDNTATIAETGQADTATVAVNCHKLEVRKDANTWLTRTWDWTIEETADMSELVVPLNGAATVNFGVNASTTSTDGGYGVDGTITVTNPTSINAVINGVADVMTGGVTGTVDCGDISFPYTLAAGEGLTCAYSADLPDATVRTNTATVTQQNFRYGGGGEGAESGTTESAGTADVDFANAVVTEIDECVLVSDTAQGELGTVCANDAPKTFEYGLVFGSGDGEIPVSCSDQTFINTASFLTNDTEADGEDGWTLKLLPLGCDKVLGDSTSAPQVLGAATTAPQVLGDTILPDTGDSPVIIVMIGLVLIGTAIGIAVVPRKAAEQ